jgi:hypothetical protein
MNIESLTPEQKELLCNLVQADENGKTRETGYVNVREGDDEVKFPRFGDKPLLPRDFEALCDAGLLVLERRKPSLRYRIKNSAYEIARLLKSEKQAQTVKTSTPTIELPGETRTIITKRGEFLQQLEEAFNDGELKKLCFGLSVDYDNLSGQTKTERLISLTTRFERENRINDLIELCKKKRPNHRWEGFVSS